jgi:hypothetical protein
MNRENLAHSHEIEIPAHLRLGPCQRKISAAESGPLHSIKDHPDSSRIK